MTSFSLHHVVRPLLRHFGSQKLGFAGLLPKADGLHKALAGGLRPGFRLAVVLRYDVERRALGFAGRREGE